MLNHAEAQELHECIGAAIDAGDTSMLQRARELAAVLVSDAGSMIMVEIHDEEDGRVSFEIGPFETEPAANAWKKRFVRHSEIDADLVEVHNINRRLYDPNDKDDMDAIYEFYE